VKQWRIRVLLVFEKLCQFRGLRCRGLESEMDSLQLHAVIHRAFIRHRPNSRIPASAEADRTAAIDRRSEGVRRLCQAQLAQHDKKKFETPETQLTCRAESVIFRFDLHACAAGKRQNVTSWILERGLLLLHPEVVKADVRCLAATNSLQREFVLTRRERGRGDIECYAKSGGGPMPREITHCEDVLAASRVKLRAKSRVLVPRFELNLDTRELSG
jgi:hypothetical protein